MIRKLLLLVCLVLVVSIPLGLYYWQTTKAPKNLQDPFVFDPKNHTNDEYTPYLHKDEFSFQVSPPKDWTSDNFKDLWNLRTRLSFSSAFKKSPDASDPYKYRGSVQVSVIEETNGDTLENLVAKNKELIKNSGTKVDFLIDKPIKVNGEKSHKLEFVSTVKPEYLEEAAVKLGKTEDIEWYQKQRDHYVYYFFIRGGLLYAASGLSYEQHWQEFEKDIIASLNSFKFLD